MDTARNLRRVERAERIARKLDAAFRLPGTRIRFGWDSVLGLVPGVGDALTVAPAAYILKIAHDTDAPTALLARMAANVVIDWITGLVPIVGDLLDVGYKANLRNVALLREHVEKQHSHATAQTQRPGRFRSARTA
ncbi:DUF4112 domain-containing protein [Lutimaribacter marinistellae]|uniref:DUF4112 domain-containing protein n=1 Tax=Lutimaribacter marinistellae TaxID=1820329 RepID=A0ABV7TLW4_9RHOB